MSTAKQFGPTGRASLALLVLAPALLLGACSSRDTVLAEKLAAADAAATRAEKAAGKIDKQAAPVQVDAEPDDLQDPGPDQDQQNATAPVDHS